MNRLALFVGQTGVIRLGLNAVAIEVLSNVLGGFLQGDVDDARQAPTVGHPLHQASALVLAAYRLHQQIEVGPIETGGDDILRGDGEFRLHVRDDLRRRRGRQQQGLRNIELALVVRQLQVVGTKIVPPLRDAVRFVDHQQRDRHLLQEIAEAFVFQTLHGNHQDLQLAGTGAGHHVTGIVTALRRIDAACRNATAPQELKLILHQRQQRRDHQRQVRQQQRRQLITQGLAGAGGENRRRRAPSQHRADGGLLTGTKPWITENLFQGVVHSLSLL